MKITTAHEAIEAHKNNQRSKLEREILISEQRNLERFSCTKGNNGKIIRDIELYGSEEEALYQRALQRIAENKPETCENAAKNIFDYVCQVLDNGHEKENLLSTKEEKSDVQNKILQDILNNGHHGHIKLSTSSRTFNRTSFGLNIAPFYKISYVDNIVDYFSSHPAFYEIKDGPFKSWKIHVETQNNKIAYVVPFPIITPSFSVLLSKPKSEENVPRTNKTVEILFNVVVLIFILLVAIFASFS